MSFELDRLSPNGFVLPFIELLAQSEHQVNPDSLQIAGTDTLAYTASATSVALLIDVSSQANAVFGSPSDDDLEGATFFGRFTIRVVPEPSSLSLLMATLILFLSGIDTGRQAHR